MNDIAAPLLGNSSSRMIEFLLSLKVQDIPASVIHVARLRLLDTLGCGIYGSQTPWGRIVAEVAYEEQSHGRATLYGHGEPVAPARAALVNGTATHGFELDDAALIHVHPGAVVVPAALALAEQHELSGERLLLGLIAGYEATSRTAIAMGEVGWGFHKAGIAGVVGSAVAGGVTLNLPHEQIMRAIGIACSSAAGIKSFLQGDGGMIKRMHAGRASESGVLACLLARRGFTAPRAALDGKFGLLEVYASEKPNPMALEEKLGESYVVVSRTKVKAYPFCYGIHTMAQALVALRAEHGIEYKAIRSVRVGTNKRALVLHPEVAPKETMAAQYSMPYIAAVALVKDAMDPRLFSGDALGDPAVCTLAQKVELYADPEMEKHYPARHGAHVTVCLDNGRTLETTVLDAKGTTANPCTEEEIRQKFHHLASVAQTDEAVAEIVSLVDRVETLPSVATLSKALRAGIRA